MLDASKAFDRVHYVKLFRLLLDKGICPLVARLLSFLYTNQSMAIKWGSSVSRNFKVSNGVKQGGILSPIIFTIYMDELFVKLKKCGVGCYIGSYFMGGFGYGDDGAVVAPTVYSLKYLLKICDEFGKAFNVLFNVAKYQLLHYFRMKVVDNFKVFIIMIFS